MWWYFPLCLIFLEISVEDMPHRFRFRPPAARGNATTSKPPRPWRCTMRSSAMSRKVPRTTRGSARRVVAHPRPSRACAWDLGKLGENVGKTWKKRLKKRCKQRFQIRNYLTNMLWSLYLGQSWVKGWSMGHVWAMGVRSAWFQTLLVSILMWETISQYSVQPILVENLNWACRGIPLTRGM